MVVKAAIPIFKYVAQKTRKNGYTPKDKKTLDYYEYEGGKYQPKDLARVKRFDPDTRKSKHVLVPREMEEARISDIGISSVAKPTKPKPSDKKIEAIKKYDALSDDELRYLTEEKSRAMGVNPEMYLAPYRQKRLGPGLNYGVRTKFTDEMGRPVYMTKYGDAVEELTPGNAQIVKDTMSKINTAAKMPVNAYSNLIRHLGRMLSQSKAQKKVSQDQVIQKFSQLDAPFIANLLGGRTRLNQRQIAKAKELGILDDDELLELSHIIRAADDPMKSFDNNNLFLSMRKQNRDVTRQQMPEENFLENYESMLDDRIKNYYGYSKGGLIKKGLQKLLDSTSFNQSRRKFLKQSGAAAAMTTLPAKTLASIVPKVATKAVTRFAPPWVKSMVGVLDQLSGPNAMGRTLANGTMIRNFGSKGNTQSFEITNSDGYKVPVNMTKEKNGDLDIEFDIRDDFSNNQHIYMDKKTGTVEIVDENYYMTSPEDYAKDDPIIWDVTTPSQMDEYAKKMGVMKGDVDDYMLDYASTPEDGDYTDLFESFIDSFSPSGSIFKTKQKAEIAKNKKIQEETYKKAQAQKRLEDDEMRFEEQFRGGNIHSYREGGDVRPRFKPKPENPARFNFIKNLTDQEAMARMMMAEDSSQQGGYGVAHVINNRANHPNYVNRYGSNSNQGISPIISVLSGKNQFTPYSDQNTRFFSDFKGQDLDLYDDYYKYAGQVLSGEIEDFTQGADFFALPSVNFEGNSFGLAQEPEYLNQHGAHNFYKSYNSGGIARRPGAVPPEKGPDPLAKNIRADVDNIIQFPQKFAGGGIVKKLLAPNVLGKLTNYKPQIAGASKIKRNKFIGPQASPDQLPPVEPGAMFWGSREKIIDAPMQQMKGNEWLAYLKRPYKNFNPIKDMELNDTSLSTHLSRKGNETISKEQLVKDFDSTLAPEIKVVALGETRDAPRSIGDSIRIIDKIDTQALRDPRQVNVLNGLKNQLGGLKEEINQGNMGAASDVVMNRVRNMENIVEKNYGVANAFTKEVPQRFPFTLKKIINDLSSDLKLRQYGFDNYQRRAQYGGQQTLGGGDNYREFLFKYNHKPGSPRLNEPQFKYTHDFGLDDVDRTDGFVHMRTSDRNDEFGRRILFIEEIQSDMHQKINMAQRSLKKQNDKFKQEGLTPQQARNRMSGNEQRDYDALVRDSKYAPRQDIKKEINANQQQMVLIQSKIEELLTQPQSRATQVRLVRLNKERAKIRKILEEDKLKLASDVNTTGTPQGPLSKTEDYNEFVMKYATKVAQEGGYDGVSIASAAIKNRNMTPGGRDYNGNLTAYGPIANGAMKKVANKTGAKFMKTAITDNQNRGWEIPMILLKENAKAINKVSRGVPIYKKGGIVKDKK